MGAGRAGSDVERWIGDKHAAGVDRATIGGRVRRIGPQLHARDDRVRGRGDRAAIDDVQSDAGDAARAAAGGVVGRAAGRDDAALGVGGGGAAGQGRHDAAADGHPAAGQRPSRPAALFPLVTMVEAGLANWTEPPFSTWTAKALLPVERMDTTAGAVTTRAVAGVDDGNGGGRGSVASRDQTA